MNAAAGQLRASGMGGATGIDMGAAAAIMKIKGCDSAEVLELVAAAEGGIVRALNDERDKT